MLRMSVTSTPRLEPLMVNVVPPVVGPLLGWIVVIMGRSQFLDIVLNAEEQFSE